MTRNKHCKAEDKADYTIHDGVFDIKRNLERPSIMRDGNKSLQTMGLQNNNHPHDVVDDMVPTHDGTKVFTFTTNQPSMKYQLLDVLNRNKVNLTGEVSSLLKFSGITPQGGREKK